jgi:multiple sugar transport system substrate-binding protein
MSFDHAKELLGRSLNRRSLVQGAAAVGLTLPLTSRFAGAQEATPSASFIEPTLPDLSGTSLNFLIIQPHAVTGDLLKQEFEAKTGAKVEVTVVDYADVQQKATLDVQSGANQLDVIDYWYPTIGALSTQGILEDLTEFIEGDSEIDIADFLPSIFDTYTLYDGKRWGLPYDGDTHVLFYNTEIYEKAGIAKAPETWDEHLQNSKIITEAGLTTAEGKPIYGTGLQAFKAPIIIVSTYANRLAGFGGTFLDADGNPTLDTEAAVAAAQALVDVAPYALPTPLETAFDQALPAFLGGEIAQMDFWTNLGAYAEDPAQSKIVGKWDVVQNPIGGSNTTHIAPLDAGFAFGVSSGSKNKDAAKAFVKWATSKYWNERLLLISDSGIDPNRQSTLNSPAYTSFAPKVQNAASAAFNGALAWPTVPQSPDLLTKLADELALLLQGNQDATATLANVQDGWKQILGK